MSDAFRDVLTPEQKAAYVPPPCPDCGSANVKADWHAVDGGFLLVALVCRTCWEAMVRKA